MIEEDAQQQEEGSSLTADDVFQQDVDSDHTKQLPPRTAGKYEMRALPGRRAPLVQPKLLLLLVAALGVVAIGLGAYSGWLAFQPPEKGSARRLAEVTQPTNTAPPSPDSTTPPGSPQMAITATVTPRPEAPTPSSTPTMPPTPTPTAMATRGSQVAGPTMTPTRLPPPTLLEPLDGATPFQQAIFRWRWEGPALNENQAFDLRIWSAQEQETGTARRGAVAPTQEMEVSVNLPYVPAIQDYGPGDYFWTVVVVEVGASPSRAVVSEWGEARGFVYR